MATTNAERSELSIDRDDLLCAIQDEINEWFSDPRAEQKLHAAGVETMRCDLLDRDQLVRLPKVANPPTKTATPKSRISSKGSRTRINSASKISGLAAKTHARMLPKTAFTMAARREAPNVNWYAASARCV